jgi:hypothetical protein
MGLILQPALTDLDRQAVEQHLEVVRNRRLSAAIVWQQGENAKQQHQLTVVQRRIEQVSGQLAKAIERLDKADENVTKYLEKLTTLLQEHGLIADLIAIAETPSDS